MCGIAGFVSRTARSEDELRTVVRSMSDRLIHRGPDDGGQWVDVSAGVALGHRRLAILDLSPEGHQPMHSACGRYVITFNGEIYNYLAIRSELESEHAGVAWRGHSDTEVLIEAISHWGIEATLKRLNGMFAFAVWDRSRRVLYLARDRMGEKPLYYGFGGSHFIFASELKAMRKHRECPTRIDRHGASLFLRYGYVPAPLSIYEGISKLLPGWFLELDVANFEQRLVPYWKVDDVAQAGMSNPLNYSDSEAIDSLDSLLRDAVKIRMAADVPLGAFLSGGIDSSLVVALMQAQSSQRVKTFSIGFYEDEYNEARYAKAVARHLETDHTELFVTSEDAMRVIPSLPEIYDEPFADSSQIPTYLVSRLARQQVTVSLSGDGGDELFFGYNRYVWGDSAWRRIRLFPSNVRKALCRAVCAVPVDCLDSVIGVFRFCIPRGMKGKLSGDRLHKLAGILEAESACEVYDQLVSFWRKDECGLAYVGEESIAQLPFPESNAYDFRNWMMLVDMQTYLPDDILVKVDRASMAVSLEARVPLLDHRVVEYAWRTPLFRKLRSGTGKWILRRVLSQYVPDSLFTRPKTGFGVPIGSWMRGPLREWTSELLNTSAARRHGLVNYEAVARKWDEHLSGRRNWSQHIWNVMMLHAWLLANNAAE